MSYNLDYLDQIDIALLAPSRAGKSTLIAAMYKEFNKRLQRLGTLGNQDVAFQCAAGDDIHGYPSEVLKRNLKRGISTQTHIDQLVHVHKDSLRKAIGKRFQANAPGSKECSLMSFNLRNNQTSMPFRILDYPGGAVAADSIVAGATDDNANVLKTYSEDCFALVVPVFALALMEKYELEEELGKGKIDHEEYYVKDSRLDSVLCIEDIKSRVADWIFERVKNNKRGLLIFTPIKCEVYLNGDEKESLLRMALLENVVKLYVFSQIMEDIKVTAQGDKTKLDAVSELVSVEYLPVQTFGNVFDKAMIEWPVDIVQRKDEPHVTFSDIYYKKRGATLCPSGAAGIIQTVLKHRNDILADAAKAQGQSLQKALASQGFLKSLLGAITGRNKATRNKITASFQDACNMNEFVREIAELELGTKNLKSWDWDFNNSEIESSDDDTSDEWED